jgi:hypothetical protein
MALSAFFDESETEGHDDPPSVAGYVFKPREYKRFDRQWQRLLRAAPGGRLPFIHMKDLYHGQKTAKDRTFDQRREIIGQTSQLIADYMLCGAGVQIRQDEFEREAPTNWPDVYGSIYASACQLCLRSTVHWLRVNNVAGSVVYAFEKGYKREVSRSNHRWRVLRPQDASFVPLQNALLCREGQGVRASSRRHARVARHPDCRGPPVLGS